jgi:hypothetical protein
MRRECVRQSEEWQGQDANGSLMFIRITKWSPRSAARPTRPPLRLLNQVNPANCKVEANRPLSDRYGPDNSSKLQFLFPFATVDVIRSCLFTSWRLRYVRHVFLGKSEGTLQDFVCAFLINDWLWTAAFPGRDAHYSRIVFISRCLVWGGIMWNTSCVNWIYIMGVRNLPTCMPSDSIFTCKIRDAMSASIVHSTRCQS